MSLLSFIGSMSISMLIDSLAGVLEGVGFGVGQDLIAGVQVGSGLASFKTSPNEGLIFPASVLSKKKSNIAVAVARIKGDWRRK